MFLAFFMGAFTRERARKPYLVWGTMPMNQQLIGEKKATPPPGTALNGEQVFKDQGCLACHKFNGEGGTIGPDLTDVASRYDKTKLMDFIRQPQGVAANRMPSFAGSEDELDALADHLLKK